MLKNKLYIISLESVESRYTYYWKEHLPKMFSENTWYDVINIEGKSNNHNATKGAFLNFADTNMWKSEQAEYITKQFQWNLVREGDVFLFADAWNPVILQTRYMIDLLGSKAKIASIWHAGSYDPADFLGRLIPEKEWSYNAERSFFYASDINFFATEFHIDMMTKTLGIERDHKSIVRTGFPMEYMSDQCYSNPVKDIICFPHRISEEKNIDLFRNIARALPEYKFVVCQDKKLTKAEYYDILSRSKIVWSANKQETLGLGVVEGLLSGAMPFVPDHLSYSEMYSDCYKYSPEISIASHISCIKYFMETDHVHNIHPEQDRVYTHYLNGNIMYKKLEDLRNDISKN